MLNEKKRIYKFHLPRERLYLLAQNNNDLRAGGSKQYVSSIHYKKKDLGGGDTQLIAGSTSLPSQPRVEHRDTIIIPTVGGLSTTELSDTKKKYYFVVNSMGIPVRNGEVSYLAASPSSAAVKAFYAWWRTTKQGAKCIERSSVTEYRSSLVPKELLQHLLAMNTDKVSQEQKKEYVKQFLCIDEQKIQRQILIRIGAAGGKSSVRAYLVGYKKNLSPNPLEVVNKMVVTATASPIPLTSTVPENVVEYESLGVQE
jgi:hypothetical protein